LAADRVDLGVYVATLHHLPSRPLRVRSLRELGRVLAPGGRALVGVWSVTHDRCDAEEAFDTTVDWTLPDGTVVDRYYHIYDGEAFGADIDAAGLERRRTFESRGNWYAVVGPEG
ncbi:MAG: SAM-dependent methyltransferase, partial [Halobacteriales archaeon]|nr:SAM-dependent methyltransferase [Halobacteriales archaeon]